MKLLLFLVLTSSLHAQSWTPNKAVAITTYNPLARNAEISADVVVACTLDSDGNVTDTEIVSGHPLLTGQSRRNALLWKLARVKQQSEHERITLTYRYSLRKERSDSADITFELDLPDVILVKANRAVVNP